MIRRSVHWDRNWSVKGNCSSVPVLNLAPWHEKLYRVEVWLHRFLILRLHGGVLSELGLGRFIPSERFPITQGAENWVKPRTCLKAVESTEISRSWRELNPDSFVAKSIAQPLDWLMGKTAYWSVSREYAKLRKATINFAKSVSLSVSIRPSTCNNSVPTGMIFMKFDIWGFSKICRENSLLNKIWRE